MFEETMEYYDDEGESVDPTIIFVLLEAYAAFQAWQKADRPRNRKRLQRSLWAIYDSLKG